MLTHKHKHIHFYGKQKREGGRGKERMKFGIFLLYNYDAKGNLEYL